MIDQAVVTIDTTKRYQREAVAMKLAMGRCGHPAVYLQGVTLASRRGLTPTPFSNEYTLADYITADK